MPPNILFICGLHRSGTTLLENYLHDTFTLMSLRADVPENEGQFLQTVYKPAFHYGGPGKFAFSKTMNDDLSRLTQYGIYRSKILNDWLNYSVGEGDFLLEKSPPNVTKMWWLRKVFPDAYFILWTRDPRAVSAATQKWSRTSLPELMMHWNVAYSKALSDIDEKTFVLRYEDFCENPMKSLDDCGLSKILTPRPQSLDHSERFRMIQNSNEKYLAYHECKNYGIGAWNQFCYDL